MKDLIHEDDDIKPNSTTIDNQHNSADEIIPNSNTTSSIDNSLVSVKVNNNDFWYIQ
jgi:hypothetical protein